MITVEDADCAGDSNIILEELYADLNLTIFLLISKVCCVYSWRF